VQSANAFAFHPFTRAATNGRWAPGPPVRVKLGDC
jgi:hypothetical protein